MESAVYAVGHYVALSLEAIAIILIAAGSIEAVVNIIRILLTPRATTTQKRAVWLEFAQWLVAALTFQLGSDIVSTSLYPSWEDVGRLAAIAGIRTFLSFFLDREVESARKLQQD